MTDRSRSVLARLMLLAGAALWGSSYFILKNTLDEVPVYLLLAIRFFFAGLILLAVRAPRLRTLNRRCVGTGALTGLFLALAYIFQTVGLTHTTPGTSAFLTTVYCILVPFLSFAFTRKRPDVYNLVAAAACLAGIGLISLDAGLSFSFSGEGMTLIGGVFFALQIVAVEAWCADEDVLLHTAVQFLTAFAVCFVCALAAGHGTLALSFSRRTLLALAYVTVFVTALAFVLMNVGIKYTTANTSSLILSLEAVFGVAFSMIFYHERPSLQKIVGFAVILAAVLLSELKPGSRRRSAP